MARAACFAAQELTLATNSLLTRQLLTLVLVAFQLGCVPTVTRIWDVQPVTGFVFDSETGEPVEGAHISNLHNPDLSAITSDRGEFVIKPVSHVTLHIVLPASYLDSQVWQIRHEDFGIAVAVTRTLAPALIEQRQSPSVPLFRELKAGPESCPFGPYLLRLYAWKVNQQSRIMPAYENTPDPYFVPCADSLYRDRLSQAFSDVL
ncbi:MAG: hypothetical protein R6W86_11195 [Marinobacter sp.]|uniref:hypothetical protein n=1 Tax=Marinobacter sp. TaxID=50741 RepID=UPI00396DE4D1